MNETDNTDDFKTFEDLFCYDCDDSQALLLKEIVEECKSAGLLFQQKKIKQLLIDKGKAFKKTNKGQTCIGICFARDMDSELDFLPE